MSDEFGVVLEFICKKYQPVPFV